jgi:RHS repeat-associated protein
VDQNTNRINTSGYGYDAAGNMTSDSLSSYAYDAENRLTQVNPGASPTATYTYLGALRVERQFGGTTVYVYSGTQPIAEYAAGAQLTQPNKEYIYSGSQLLATVDASLGTSYQYHDHLSTRVEADASANVTRTFGHFPYGETWYETGSASKWKFTSYERAATGESDLDYADFRFYSSRLGRFMGADPLAGDAGSPQSLNRYAYVMNDPVNAVDPTGLDYCPFDDSGRGGDHCGVGREGGGSGTCVVDGQAMDCGVISGLLMLGAVGQCYQNDCTGYGKTWKFSELGDRLMVCVSCGVNSTSTSGDLFILEDDLNWVDMGPTSIWAFALQREPPISSDLKSLMFRPWSVGILVPFSELPVGIAGTLAVDPSKRFSCLGVGIGVGLRGINGGPLWGDTQKSRAILSGGSVTVNAAGPIGVQRIENLNGALHGPTVGNPGLSLSITYSWCTGK